MPCSAYLIFGVIRALSPAAALAQESPVTATVEIGVIRQLQEEPPWSTSLTRAPDDGFLVTFFIRMAPAQAAVEGDWPCIQRKVGELTAAQMWDGPDLDTAGHWRTDPTVAGLAARACSSASMRSAAAWSPE